MQLISNCPKIKKKKSGKKKHPGLLSTDRLKEFWDDPVIRKKMLKYRSTKNGISPEGRKAHSESIKKVNQRLKESGHYERLKLRKIPQEEIDRKKYERNRTRTHRCPFVLVDGVIVDVVKKERYNTHSGVITERQLEEINGK
jgi:hypothetical protein